jgi:tetratricopeptide (TPR) repeat protein
MSARTRGLARFGRGAASALVVGALALGGSCFAERRGLTRHGLLQDLEARAEDTKVPTLEELLALRAPVPAERPPAIDAARPTSPLDVARLAAARGDIAAAEKAWVSANADLLAHRCLVEGVLRRYDALLESCERFLSLAPEDPRALPATRILLRAGSGKRAAGDLVAHAGPGWVKACAARRGACADLAFTVADKAVETARAKAERPRFADAVLATGRLRRARLEGPFAGDVRVLWAKEARDEELPLRAPHAERLRSGSAELVDEDGLFEPALGGPSGLYRLVFGGRGAGPATLYVTGAGAVRVRIDGTIVAERSPDAVAPAVTRAGVELSAGDHLIEVLAWSSGRGDRIAVALLDASGRPALREGEGPPPPRLPGGKGKAGKKSTSKEPGARLIALAGMMEALAEPIAGAPDDVNALHRLLWRQVVARGPALGVDADENKQIARALIARYGWSPLALAVAAEVMGDDRSVPARVASSTAARLWSRVRAAWPDHPVAHIAAARALRQERPEEALAAYRALIAARPEYPFGHRELIDLALEVGLTDDALASAHALLALEESPENIDAAAPALRAAGELVRLARLEEKRALFEESLSDARPARRLLEEGRTDEGLAALAAASAAERASPALEEHLALLAVRDPAAALALVERHLMELPADESLFLKKAELLRHLRGDTEARAFLLEALPLIRESERARRLSEALGVAPPWAGRLRLGDEAIASLRARTSAPFPGHGLLALVDDIERVFYEDDTSLIIRHLVMELRTKEVLDRFGEISTGDARVIRLRVVKPDGAVVEPERHRGLDDVSLPDLAPGDIFEMITVALDPPTQMSGVFETRSLDGSSTPALSRRYLVSFPEGWDEARRLDVLAMNGLPPPLRTTVIDGEGRRRVALTFALDDVAPAAPEPSPPARAEWTRVAGIAWGVDEAVWSRLRGVSIEHAARRDAWLDACAARIAGAGRDDEKLRRLFAFVARRIEPDGGRDDATAVLATGQGVRTPLLLALARAAGLDASPVAIQLPIQADPSTYDTSSWSLVAVRVRHSGRESFAIVDGNAVLDQLPPFARGARVLDLSLAPRGPLVSPLPDAVIDESGVLVQAELAVEGAAEKSGDRAGDRAGAGRPVLRGLVVVTVPAAKADGARRGVRRATAAQLQQVLERSLADSLPGVHVLEVKTPDVEAAGGPLRIGARVEVPLPDPADGAARFEHLFAQGASGGLQLIAPVTSYLAVADRRQPLLVTADREVLEVQIALPRAAAFVEAPEPLALTAGPFSLRQKVEITDGVLLWRRELRTRNARVPVDGWPSLRASLAAMAARTDARLSFVLPRAQPVARGAAAPGPLTAEAEPAPAQGLEPETGREDG